MPKSNIMSIFKRFNSFIIRLRLERLVNQLDELETNQLWLEKPDYIKARDELLRTMDKLYFKLMDNQS